MKNLQKIIEGLVNEEIKINETIRGFNFNKFKSIQNHKEKIAFAKKYLPHMGTGSSRIVFAYSSGKVLKIAINKAGFAQNKAEVEVWTNPKTKPVITTIFDADTQNYHWLISEIAKPISNIDEWAEKIGIRMNEFSNFVHEWFSVGEKDVVSFLKKELKQAVDDYMSLPKERIHAKKVAYKRYERYKFIYKSPFLMGVLHLISNGMMYGDIIGETAVSHYGITSDGRPVIIDFGFTEDVADNFYKNPNAENFK